ncbi:Actin-regulating kinase PRK1 [Nakaseomyces bracarensis]|uniref:Actin-regulating kinase PRK1 n=1 Tax=Nakaseomyces bracarensis TaxID=273131 RepID=UPI003872274C
MNTPHIPKYEPGLVVAVGSHQARITKYLTSGGYAQIYSTHIVPADSFCGSNIACLKRVIVPDKNSLNVLRAEVDAMKRLRHNKYIVSYIDSNAARSQYMDGTYEVFLLMEYCSRGGLIDFMNSRLQNRLTEQEVLIILLHVSQGVAAMHTLQPPLIHRDIKIENVLISDNMTYKLCDFGSVSGFIRPPKTPQELSYVQHDIMMSTTAQYRAPEMLDLTKGFAVNDKSDIWALGVFLYKLCYYTTPFEQTGEAGILNGMVDFPHYPVYSDPLKQLVLSMLAKNPLHRPNIFQIIQTVSNILHINCPIPNITNNIPTYPTQKANSIGSNTGNYYNNTATSSGATTPHSINHILAAFQNDVKTGQSISSLEPIQRSKTLPTAYSSEANDRSDISEFLLRKKASLQSNLSSLHINEDDDDSSSTSSDNSIDDSASLISKTRSLNGVSLIEKANAELRANETILEDALSSKQFFDSAPVLDKVKSETKTRDLGLNKKEDVKLKRKSLPIAQTEIKLAEGQHLRNELNREDKKEQLRKRMMDALNASEEVIRHTKVNGSKEIIDDLSEITRSTPKNKKEPNNYTEDKRYPSVIVKSMIETTDGKAKRKVPPKKPPKPEHLKPKVPPKPAFLSSKT